MMVRKSFLPVLLVLLTACMGFGEPLPVPPIEPGSEAVVLVHGLGRSPVSMMPLGWTLERQGYRVVNYGYLSPIAGVEDHGADLAAVIAALDDDPDISGIHLVGHSLGNLLIRWVMAYEQPQKMGRVVMLAPPNQGSRVADRAEPWLSWLAEPLSDLTTDPSSTARTLPTPRAVEIGVIAGAHDDKVAVEETLLRGQTDHRVVPAGHTFLMMRSDVHRLTAAFLRTGSFRAGEEDAQRPAEASVE